MLWLYLVIVVVALGLAAVRRTNEKQALRRRAEELSASAYTRDHKGD
jgi:hypothetical protein